MCTLARPVRVDARLAWKVATAASMRRFKSLESPLSAGLPSINDAIFLPSLHPRQYITVSLQLLGQFRRNPGCRFPSQNVLLSLQGFRSIVLLICMRHLDSRKGLYALDEMVMADAC